MDHPPTAPPVVVVVVARDPGPWFEESLGALDHQDYPNLSVLVVDAGSRVDPSARVAAALPSAYVRRVETAHGFAGAANDVLDTVKGAAFLIFCHDDVALEPDAVRRLVEEAIRSNAGIVGPKVVDWDRPERLLDVGLAVDKTGASATLAERGELDQEQHDAVRDVFAVSSTCMLVRGDLFETMAGFDEDMADHGSDVDFCWRAQVAGARVLVAPAALARHRMAVGSDDDDESTSFLAHRNHLRSMLKNYTLLHLIRVVPQAAFLLIGEVVFALAKRRFAEARELLGAWWWNVRSLPGLRGARRDVGAARAVPDSEVRRLQVRGSVRLNQYLQRQFRAEERAQALLSAGQQLVGSVGKGPAQVAAILLAVLTLTWLVGMRGLLGGRLPGVAELAPLPGTSTLLANWISGWRSTGMGIGGAAPTAFGLLGLSGFVLLGKTALLHKLIVLGAWPLAAVGVWRLTRPFSSGLARIVGVIVYASLPLSYNSLARGRLGALVAYAALPWLFSALVRATGLQPWAGDRGDGAVTAAHRWRSSVLGLGLGLAVTVALAPPTALVFLLVAAGITVGSLLVGGIGGSVRALGVAATATAVAAVLLMPWALELVIPSGGWATAVGVAPDPSLAPSLGELLRFQVGPLGAAPLGWAVLAAAAFPLVLGKGWRFEWAVRLWTVAIACWLAAWAGARGWLPVQLEAPHELLVPAALALALAAAMGAAAFDLDLRAYRFGWRQVASVSAALAVVLGVIPVFAGAGDGRFHLSGNDTARSLAWMDATASDGAFRVLWVGAPEALPLDGWSLGEGLAFATSRDGVPAFVDRFPGRASGATEAIAEVLRDAENGNTAQLGHLLAPMAIRYIVLPVALDADAAGGPGGNAGSGGSTSRAPRAGGTAAADGGEFPLPESLTRALASQIDLRLRPASAALTVYENTAWGPGRGLLAGSLPADAAEDDVGGGVDLSAAAAVLQSSRANRYRGDIPTAGRILVSESPSSRWSLTIDGRGSSRTSAFGVANVFETSRVGGGLLRYRTPVVYSLMLAIQVALWCVVGRALLRMRRHARAGGVG